MENVIANGTMYRMKIRHLAQDFILFYYELIVYFKESNGSLYTPTFLAKKGVLLISFH